MTAPTVSEVRDALAAAISSRIPELNAYDTVPDVLQFPAMMVQPHTCDYLIGGGNCQDWTYKLLVMVPHTEGRANQEELDKFLSVTGEASIPAALKADYTLGLDGCDCTLLRMDGYGGSWEGLKGIGAAPHIGAQLYVRVIVTE